MAERPLVAPRARNSAGVPGLAIVVGIVALIVIVAIVLQRRGSTAAHDLSSDYHPDTSMGGADPN